MNMSEKLKCFLFSENDFVADPPAGNLAMVCQHVNTRNIIKIEIECTQKSVHCACVQYRRAFYSASRNSINIQTSSLYTVNNNLLIHILMDLQANFSFIK